VYLVARARSAQWPVEVLRNGVAELTLPEGAARGTPTLVTVPGERERILGLFRAKYGPEAFARWYERPARVLRVALDGGPPAAGAGTASYYAWLEAEFDNVADDYDHHITGNRMNLLLRDRSLAVLTSRFRDAHRILEIGCGSGMETLPLLEQGHEVVAVDISSRMLATVQRKAESAGLAQRFTGRELAAHDLGRLVDDGFAGTFDAAFSTYGALNCEPDLAPVPPALFRLLKPGAPFVTAVYNRWCLFELLGYSLTFQERRAFGRRQNPVRVGGSRFCVDVYAHSVRDFEQIFRSGFDLERLEGVPVFLPPSDLVTYADRFSRHFDRLAAWDAAFGRRWPFNHFGDHFLMTFARRS
jgi:SAM-dependent methyltransferase